MPYIKDLVKGGFNYLEKSDDLLYSGRYSNDSIITKKVRTDRKSTDMNYDLHKMYDDIFYKKFKIYARSNAIFCSGSMIVAGGYGSTVYSIFPAGKYQVIWSDKIYDLYKNDVTTDILIKYNIKYRNYRMDILDATNNSTELKHLLKKLPQNMMSSNSEIKKQFFQEMDKKVLSTYHKGDIMKAIKSKNEIMLTCNYYIGLKNIDYNRVIRQYIEQNKTKFPEKEFFIEWYDRYIE
jgi:hypothetical protein